MALRALMRAVPSLRENGDELYKVCLNNKVKLLLDLSKISSQNFNFNL